MKAELLHLKTIPKNVFGYDDVSVKINLECNPYEFGAYYPKRKIIELNVLDNDGKIYNADLIIKILCHELAHHIQNLNGLLKDGNEHNEQFDILLWQLLGMYYEGNIPSNVREQVLIDQKEVSFYG